MKIVDFGLNITFEMSSDISFDIRLSIMTLSIVCHYAECHNAECHYAECHNAECHYAECHYTERHYVECRDAIGTNTLAYIADLNS